MATTATSMRTLVRESVASEPHASRTIAIHQSQARAERRIRYTAGGIRRTSAAPSAIGCCADAKARTPRSSSEDATENGASSSSGTSVDRWSKTFECVRDSTIANSGHHDSAADHEPEQPLDLAGRLDDAHDEEEQKDVAEEERDPLDDVRDRARRRGALFASTDPSTPDEDQDDRNLEAAAPQAHASGRRGARRSSRRS